MSEAEPAPGLIARVADGPLRGLQAWLPAAAALVAGTVILGAATLAGEAARTVFEWQTGITTSRPFAAGELEALTTAQLALFLIVFQTAIVALTWAVTGWFSGGRMRLLPLAMPARAVRLLLRSFLTLLAIASVYGLIVLAVDKDALAHDVQPLIAELSGRTWGLMLIASAIGAPIAEELLFRGFLYGVFRASPLGAWGAGLITAVMWAGMHANYSLYGIGAIFLIGLYLAALRERTGSLVAPMVCHGLYNGSIVLALALTTGGAII